jgi:hypothetical protein
LTQGMVNDDAACRSEILTARFFGSASQVRTSPFLRPAFTTPATMPSFMKQGNFWHHRNVSRL